MQSPPARAQFHLSAVRQAVAQHIKSGRILHTMEKAVTELAHRIVERYKR